MSTFENELRITANLIDATLNDVLSEATLEFEIERPQRLLDAMRYSVLGNGKRLRPFLFIQTAALFGVYPQKSVLAACALELVHCYSLIHDDLPAMDDDSLRRGKPTLHIAFDEATAILAGDSLLTLAFDLLARENVHSDPVIRSKLVLGLARASGLGGMVGGQMLDLMAEKKEMSANDIQQFQAMKTGALMRFACEGGAILAETTPANQHNMQQFGSLIGAAFQLADDILDITSNCDAMGKATGKDANAGKKTLVELYGLEEAQSELKRLIDDAKRQLSFFDGRAKILLETAQFVADRTH